MSNQDNRYSKEFVGIPTEPVSRIPRSPELQDALISHQQSNMMMTGVHGGLFDQIVSETIAKLESTGSNLQ